MLNSHINVDGKKIDLRNTVLKKTLITIVVTARLHDYTPNVC